MQSNIAVADGKITGTLTFIEGGLSPDGPLAGDGYFLALKWSAPSANATSLKIGLVPSEGTGMIEAIDDPDHNGVFKITNKSKQKLKFIQSDGIHANEQVFKLNSLTLEDTGV